MSNNPSIPTAPSQGSLPSPPTAKDGGATPTIPLGAVEVVGQPGLSSSIAGVGGVSIVAAQGVAAINATASAGASTGTLAQRPAVPSTGNGTLYFATDTGLVYIFQGGSWSTYQAGGWIQGASVSFAGVADPGLSANGTYTLAGIAGVKRENAANDRVAMAVVAGGVKIQPATPGAYTPYSAATRTAPLLWFPLSSLLPAGTALEWCSGIRVMIRVAASAQSGFDNGHSVVVGVDSDSASYAAFVQQGTDGGTNRQWATGYNAGVNTGTRNTSVGAGDAMSTGAFVMVAEIPFLLGPSFGALCSYVDGQAAWPNLSALSPVSASFESINNTNPYTTNPAPPVTLLSRLGVVIAAQSPVSNNDAYAVTVSDMRIDYRL